MSLVKHDPAERPSVLVLYFVRDKPLSAVAQHLHENLRQNANFLEAPDARTAQQYLYISPPPGAVLAADASITDPRHEPLVEALVEYVRNGGRLIFGVRFAAHMLYFDVPPFFRRFGQLWERGRLYSTTFALNPNGVPAPLSKEALSPAYTMRAQALTDVARESAVYVATSGPNDVYLLDPTSQDTRYVKECPAAFAPLLRGYIGYVGDASCGRETTQLLLEMCGVKFALDRQGP